MKKIVTLFSLLVVFLLTRPVSASELTSGASGNATDITISQTQTSSRLEERVHELVGDLLQEQDIRDILSELTLSDLDRIEQQLKGLEQLTEEDELFLKLVGEVREQKSLPFLFLAFLVVVLIASSIMVKELLRGD